MIFNCNLIKTTFVLICTGLSMVAVAQESDYENKVFDVVEQMPEFNGAEVQVKDATADGIKLIKIEKGSAGFLEYLGLSVKYPVVAEENGIQGKVICSFIVERDGSISNVQVVRSVDPALDKEACRVLRSMPNWIPGKQNEKTVRVKLTVPVTFRLRPQSHDEVDEVYKKADKAPSSPDTDVDNLSNYFANLIDYPSTAENIFIEGQVTMNLIVEKDGSISNITLRKSNITTYGDNIELPSAEYNKQFVTAAKEGIQKVSRLEPAILGGMPVRYQMELIVHFGSNKKEESFAQNVVHVYKKGNIGMEYLYEKDKKPYNDMHLYVATDGYNVSGINKPASKLTADEFMMISKKSKQTAADILKMSDERTGNSVVYDLTLDNTSNYGIERPQLNSKDGLDEYMRSHLSTSFEKIYVIASFIVETDGRISCPVVEKGYDLKAVKAVIHQLRKTKGWQPALKNGIPVRARIQHTFSYKRVVTTVTRTVPVYSQPSTFIPRTRRRY